MSTTTPNMGLLISTVGGDSGLLWEQNLNASLTVVDGHNHSPGNGVQVQPNGLNINSDLTFNSNNATSLRTTRYTAQISPITNSGADVGEIYVSGNELYYNDVSGGNQVKITSNGSVNAGAGSITGLPSGTASATYSAGTFVWQSATSTAANMDAGSYVFRNSSANSHGLTLSPPAAMAADISMTLPAIPGAQSFMAIDASGNMSGFAAVSGGLTGAMIAGATVTRTNQVAVGQQVSTGSGGFTHTGNTTVTAVTNLSVTITTSGRPVMLMLQADGSGNFTDISYFPGSGPAQECQLIFKRGSTTLSKTAIFTNQITGGGNFLAIPPGACSYLDVISAGTYTYTFNVQLGSSGDSVIIDQCVLVAYEL